MSEEHYRILCLISAFCFVLGGVLLVLVSRKRYRELDEMGASQSKLQARIDAPGIDEEWAHQLEETTEPEMNTTVRKALPIIADERDIAIRTLYGEARGESREGRIAVAWVIRNRVEIDLGRDGKPDWWGEGVIGVCCKAGQFSCWNAGDPNLPKLKSLRTDDPLYRMLGAIVDAVFAGDIADPTWGSTHYHTVNVSPKWAVGLRSVTSIGAHLFYNDVP